MADEGQVLAKFSGVVRIFPLPRMVFFPNVIQGLHIFEPRYRQMTNDAIDDDGLIALVQLPETTEQEYLDEPEIEEYACLGQVVYAEKFADGRFNLRLRGLCRVQLVEELATDKMYRTARAELVPDITPANAGLLQALRRQLAAAVLPRFEPTAPAFQHLVSLFASEAPLGTLVDMLSFTLPVDVNLKQALLAEPHVQARVELLAAVLNETNPRRNPNPNLKFPPEFSLN
ncbi:MAG: LON peptidase substrate-binding domain-containing protein [Fimbriiglobus sp.]